MIASPRAILSPSLPANEPSQSPGFQQLGRQAIERSRLPSIKASRPLDLTRVGNRGIPATGRLAVWQVDALNGQPSNLLAAGIVKLLDRQAAEGLAGSPARLPSFQVAGRRASPIASLSDRQQPRPSALQASSRRTSRPSRPLESLTSSGLDAGPSSPFASRASSRGAPDTANFSGVVRAADS